MFLSLQTNNFHAKKSKKQLQIKVKKEKKYQISKEIEESCVINLHLTSLYFVQILSVKII